MTFTDKIKEAVDACLVRESEKIIKIAMHDFEREIRAVVAGVVLKLMTVYRVETMGNELVIRVEIKQP